LKLFFHGFFVKYIFSFMRLISISVALLLFAFHLSAQGRKLTYNVVRNGKVIGTLDFVESISNNSIHFNLNSEVKTRFVFTFTVTAKEESIYKDGILIYSSIYRNFNGNVKIDRQMRFEGGVYHVSNKGEATQMKIDPIHYNFHGLYLFEPKQLSLVFSDNFGKYMTIIKMPDNKYKVNLPDGNYNYYYYKDGICQKVEMFTSLYTAQMVLKK
jgi:hypothetical protein